MDPTYRAPRSEKRYLGHYEKEVAFIHENEEFVQSEVFTYLF
jgi:hypothetical protein